MRLNIVYYLYKDCDNLVNSLDSLFKQTNKKFNLIFVDDFCTSEVFEIANKYIKNNSNVKVIKFSENLGMSYCYNCVLKIFKGDYIYFAEQKVIFEPNFVERIQQIAEDGKLKYDFISFDKKIMDLLPKSSKINHEILIDNKNLNYSFIVNSKLSFKFKIFKIETLLENNINFQNYKNHHSVFLYSVIRSSKSAFIVNEKLLDWYQQKERFFEYNLYDILESAEILNERLNFENFTTDERETYEIWIYILILYEFLKKMFISYWGKNKILNSAIENANNLINRLTPMYKKNTKLIYLIDKKIYNFLINFVPTIAYVKKSLF